MIKYIQDVKIGRPVTPVPEEVFNWAESLGVKVGGGGILINPRTFEGIQTWYFESEEVKLLFLLKWSGT